MFVKPCVGLRWTSPVQTPGMKFPVPGVSPGIPQVIPDPLGGAGYMYGPCFTYQRILSRRLKVM